MNVKKIAVALGVFIVIVAGFAIYSNKTVLSEQEQAEKNFSEFLSQKKKLPGEVSLILAQKETYFWNGAANNFERISNDASTMQVLERKTLKKEQADLDEDLVMETYNLENGILTIAEGSKAIWQSPSEWWIDSFVLADSNNDGITDINLSLWKAGNFGPSKPFWIEKNNMSVKNHFFVLDFIDKTAKQIWGSSNLEAPNCEFDITDIDGDKKNDLIVLEGDYSSKPACNANFIAVWKWNGWGFSNEWRGKQGNFLDLKTEKNNGKEYITANSF